MKDSSVSGSDAEQQRFSFDMNPVGHRVDPASNIAEQESPETAATASAGEPLENAGYDSNKNDDMATFSSQDDEVTTGAESVVPTRDESRELPGRVLAAERKRRGFSVSEIAGQLFLTEEQIHALETDNYGFFPAPIFVTGYIRNYARLLDLPADPLIELLGPGMVQSTPKLNQVSKTAKKAQPASQSSPLDPRLIGGAVGVVVLLLIWWFVTTDSDAPHTQIDDVALSDSASVTPQPVREPIAVTSQPVVPVKPAVTPPAPASVPEPAVVNKPVVAAAPEPVAEPELQADVPPAPEFIPDRAAAEAYPDTLELTFTAESWVEITDASGRRVMFDLGKPGQTRALSGVAPFKILFGYSPAVSMIYNGEPFDQGKFTRGKVARFTLGGAE